MLVIPSFFYLMINGINFLLKLDYFFFLFMSVLYIYYNTCYISHQQQDKYPYCIYNHRTTKTNQKYPSVNL